MPDLNALALRSMLGEKARNLLRGDSHAVLDPRTRVRKEDDLEARAQVHLLGAHPVRVFD